MTRQEAINAAKLLKALIGISEVDIILTTFIAAFESKSISRGEFYFLCGNLILGGTQSGRLSSRDPNMQNLPSGSLFGKLIKSCFVAPPGWLFGGADFSALEDRIGAILSGDRNKIKEFSEGFDGHSLRALAFFAKQIHPELQQYDIEDPDSVNRIKTEHDKIRSKAKAPSFTLQYGGTHYTLMKNLGMIKKDALEIEENYHKLYSGIAEFSKQNLQYACEHGYVNCAFGLRLRTPILSRTLFSEEMAYDAGKEGRSANNAITQSWGLLMNRALIATEERIRASKYDHSILMGNTIHDAGYFLIKKDVPTIKFLNDVLIEEMRWNDHPLIKSEEVPMEAELDIGPSWDKQVTLPNHASIEDIQTVIEDM